MAASGHENRFHRQGEMAGLGRRRWSYALTRASALPQKADHLPRPINHLFSANSRHPTYSLSPRQQLEIEAALSSAYSHPAPVL